MHERNNYKGVKSTSDEEIITSADEWKRKNKRGS